MTLNDADEEEDKVIRTSPCGRWEKRNKQFSLREFPCMLGASLAMDTEEGIEVVWIETRVKFATDCEIEQIKTTLDMVVRYCHPNLVQFHDYWIEDRDREKIVVFITESLTCGSVTQFIKKSKLNEKPIVLATWKRWCRQILLGIEYLHTRIPPYVLYNLSCDDIFIQHNGLVKIALVHSLCAVEKISENSNYLQQQQTSNVNKDSSRSLVMQYRGLQGHRFYADIVAFGKICLYIATLEPFRTNGNSHSTVNNPNSAVAAGSNVATTNTVSGTNSETNTSTNNMISITKSLLKKLKTINRDQADFIRICLNSRYNRYPSIVHLLNHSILFEMPSLALICGHACANNDLRLSSLWREEDSKNAERVIAKYSSYVTTVDADNNRHKTLRTFKECKRNEFPSIDIDKYIEDIANGMHPITCFTKEYPDTYYSYLLEAAQGDKSTVAEDFPSSTGVTNTTPTERTIDYSSQEDVNNYYTSNKPTETTTQAQHQARSPLTVVSPPATVTTSAATTQLATDKTSLKRTDNFQTKANNKTTPFDYTRTNFNSSPVEPPNLLQMGECSNSPSLNRLNESHDINHSFDDSPNRRYLGGSGGEVKRYDMVTQSSCSLNFFDGPCILRIKGNVEPVLNDQSQQLSHNAVLFPRDSYLFLKITLSDNSVMKFVFQFNRMHDSSSHFVDQVLKYHAFGANDVAFLEQAIVATTSYDAPVVCNRVDTPFPKEFHSPYPLNNCYRRQPPFEPLQNSHPTNTYNYTSNSNVSSSYFPYRKCDNH